MRTAPGAKARGLATTLFCLEPRRQHCRPSAGKGKHFPRLDTARPPEPVPRFRVGRRKEFRMKGSKSLFLGLALLLATSAFAANKGSLQIQEPTSVNGTKLAPGDYKLEWDGTGPSVELSIMQGKKVIAKVPAHVVDLSRPAQ